MAAYGLLVAFSLCILHVLGAPEKQLRLPTQRPSTSAAGIRIAWIGNSYTFNPKVEVPVPDMFALLSAEAGHPVTVMFDKGGKVTGGTTLFQHADPSHPAGKLTLDWFNDPAGWDYVVLQDHSEVPGGGLRIDDLSVKTVNLWKTQSTKALADFFGPQLKKLGAKAVLYSSWGRRDNNNLDDFPDFETMTAKTALGYMHYAKILSSKMASQPIIASVGRAMQWAKGQHGSIFDGLFQGDPSEHPTQDGAYLIACVFFASIWNKSPEGLSYAPPGVNDKLTLQRIAAHAVFDHGLPLTTARYDREIDGRVSWSDSYTAKALQAMLNAQGYSCFVDGILGKQTIQRLQEFLAVVAYDHGSASACSGSLDRTTVEGLQRYLKQQSFAPANGIDGQFDSATISALQKFLAGLPEQR